jgi:AcrR family transcriptional regulator
MIAAMATVETTQELGIQDVLAAEKADRTRAIVEAAYEIIDAGGLAELTIRAVLKRTGLARRAFYEQFAGKDDLMLAVFERTMRVGVDVYRALVAPIADPVERLKMIILAIGHGSAAPRSTSPGEIPGEGGHIAAALSREHLRLAEARPDELQHALEPLMTLIADQLADGMAVGTVRQADPARLAIFIYNLIATTMHTELIAQETTGSPHEIRDRLADELWEFCRRALAA